MRADTKRNIKESYEHVKPYMKNIECTRELREMCSHCEKYCGIDHDYEECKDGPCFKFWLCYKYLEWSNSFY